MTDRLWTSGCEIVNLHLDNGTPPARVPVPVTGVALPPPRGSTR